MVKRSKSKIIQKYLRAREPKGSHRSTYIYWV